MRVYVAGPYTADPVKCTWDAIEAGNRILDAGHEPFVPHLAHYWDRLHTARPYTDWTRLDLAWLNAAEILVRLPGESPGADEEVRCARRRGIPIYYGIGDFLSALGTEA